MYWFQPAQMHNFMILETLQQLGLNHIGNISNFIQKKSPAVGQLKEACLAPLVSAGKSTFLVAEKFGLKEVFRDGRTIYLNKRFGVPGAVAMEKFR